jgi:hypothetical protein
MPIIHRVDSSGPPRFPSLIRQDSDASARSAVACRPDFDRTAGPTGRHRGQGAGGVPLGFGGTSSGAAGGSTSGFAGPGGLLSRRQVPSKPIGTSGRRQKAARPPSIVGGPGGHNQIQLISLPQLDLVQRSLKVLDVRVQRLHTAAVEEDKVGIEVNSVPQLSGERTLNAVYEYSVINTWTPT